MKNKTKFKTKHYILLLFGRTIQLKKKKWVKLKTYELTSGLYTEDDKLISDYVVDDYTEKDLYEELPEYGYTKKYIRKLYNEKMYKKEGKIKLIVPNQKCLIDEIKRME